MSGRAVELLARASYGRLLAVVASRARDIRAAEDALSDALLAALTQWNESGVPANPEAWIVTAARRRLVDADRRASVRSREAEAVAAMLEELAARPADAMFEDDRLRLLFVCTHPAIEKTAQVPLMLQTVLGLDANAIASAMRIAPKTMGQRLWRAKTKIREAGIPFEAPESKDLADRLEAVMEAVYAAFGTAWEDIQNADVRLRDLGEEAIFLGRMLVALAPNEPEAHGLLALMLFAEARRAARRTSDGVYVPLEDQNQALWSMETIDEAERLLRHAFTLGRIGPLQLEAALQSAHVSGARRGKLDVEAVLALYEGLVQLAPSLGALVGRAAAIVDARGGAAAVSALDDIATSVAHDYQPWWAVRAAALRAAGRIAESHAAYERAAVMTEDAAVRRFLLARARSG